MTNAVMGLVTCPTRAEARKIARAILKKKLAACVNIIGGLESHYWWKGKLENAREYLLLVKTTQLRVAEVTSEVQAVHSYDVPEIVFVPFAAGERDYLKWLGESVGDK
jgi:periplasmic divalent cation tolerance protein